MTSLIYTSSTSAHIRVKSVDCIAGTELRAHIKAQQAFMYVCTSVCMHPYMSYVPNTSTYYFLTFKVAPCMWRSTFLPFGVSVHYATIHTVYHLRTVCLLVCLLHILYTHACKHTCIRTYVECANACVYMHACLHACMCDGDVYRASSHDVTVPC